MTCLSTDTANKSANDILRQAGGTYIFVGPLDVVLQALDSFTSALGETGFITSRPTTVHPANHIHRILSLLPTVRAPQYRTLNSVV